MKDSDWHIIHELHRHQSITRVAGILYKTQSAITKRLQAIEEELEVKIVDRTPSGLVFTPAGEYLASRAEEYIEFERITKEELRHITKNETALLHLGSSYTFSKYLFVPFLKEFIDAHKNLLYTVLNKQSDILYAQVLGGKLDAAFVQGDYINGVNSVLISLSQGCILSTKEINENDLVTMSRVGYQTNDNTTALLTAWWKDHFCTGLPTAVVNSGYVDFAAEQLLAGENRYMIRFLPDAWVNRHGFYVKKMFMSDGQPFTRKTWFIYGVEKRRSNILDELIQYVEKNLAIKMA